MIPAVITMANTTQMQGFIAEKQHKLMNFLYQELKFDKEVDSWMFMSTPWPVLSILAVYLLFVLKLGPKMIENRKPFNIKYIIMAYNLLQTMYNLFIIWDFFFTPTVSNYLINNVCYPDDTEGNRYMVNKMYVQSWHFVMSKIFDLLDTVFFVLRKKQSHVSFLHVYHHVIMVVTTWTYLRFFKNQQGALVGVLNGVIHSIMYSYYFLSALGPDMQKYLWWKKYLTKLQIVQFIACIIYGISLFIFDCNFPRIFAAFMIFNVLLFLYLFLIFYKKTYNVDKKKSQ